MEEARRLEAQYNPRPEDRATSEVSYLPYHHSLESGLIPTPVCRPIQQPIRHVTNVHERSMELCLFLELRLAKRIHTRRSSL